MSRSGPRDVAVAATLATFVALPVGLLAATHPTAAEAAAATPPQASPVAVSETTAPCVPAPLAARAGAVLMVGLPGVTAADDASAREAMAVGVSGVFLAASNVRTADQVRALVTGLRAESPRPLVVSTDAESGRVSVLRDVIGSGPSPRRLARQDTPAQVQAFATDLGTKLKDLGVDLDLAPVLDLDDGPYGGVIGDRSFGTDPDRVTTYATAFRDGLSAAGVKSAVKHFPGQGRSGADTHIRPATVSTPVSELVAHDLLPFQRLIDSGAPVVMMNHLDYADLGADVPASLSPAAYALLRSMGFQGAAITDSLGMGAVNTRWDFPEAAVRAIAAGADGAFATDGRQAVRMRDAIVAAVTTGRLPEARLDEAATRMARLAGADVTALTCAQS
ncbi:MAG: glycoside hydrolase family 3 domain protein [Frankiales bacterium]|nr:glycoside hydrolase family 3 domain protein [Frankiales bacterium]